MKFFVSSLIATVCFNLSLCAQVTTLDLDRGYGGIVVGDYVNDIRKLLLKDSITLRQTWDSTDSRAKVAERIYLADLKQPELDSFQGRKVERVEVYASQKHNNSIEDSSDHRQVVDYVKIYLQQEHYDDGAFQDLVGYFYVEYGQYEEEYDSPEKGDMRYTWTGQYFTFRLSNYYGEMPLNRKYDLASYYRKWE